jgi:hypothetical protein
VWETAQMPLYILWWTGTAREIAQAVLHCTFGDMVIATVALIVTLALVGSSAWPEQRCVAVIAVEVVGSAGYVIYSEYLNTLARRTWAYTDWMPTLPLLGTGLTPHMRVVILTGGIAQWNFAYRAAEKQRTFENLCDAEIEVNKTGPTRWNALKVVHRFERRFEIRVTRCL